MTLISFPHPPRRAIQVEPFNSDRTHWVATYAGDEWTASLEFKPVLPLRSLLDLLKQWPDRNGLPIVVVDQLDSEVAA
ncbi:hypothetical protein AAJ72_10035 [Citromicrobium sp. RCC1885]|uniref:hypothetical protein n=1 Tax=unclassified Citromicrobium TaxID=2630544 RepID=UPI0006C91601|nr:MULTISPECIES: hypothetical protein [unclassified Citromicrobium]KPM23233.1 hypothetical protein AAJ72_10035 [Citromicrobium sp. RCC1885]KPM26640.1 hypothetical protein AAJ74_10775 [Citromicrobium sp. RCC1878]OAM08842.1 hypothetical protein A0U43_09530 [Citromicrobium sp. RCC1897]|tara:strand:- start:1399 stop:1632 length:234 start_codon:yes stop_codon:yes gene_type:complete